MLKLITALFVIGAMLFGGAGATVHAAQDALPNDALYPLKTATEDLRLAFALDSQSELDLLLNYSERRVNEIDFLVSLGEEIPADVIMRLTAEMELVEDVISELEEPELSEAIEEVGVHIQKWDRLSWTLDDEMARNAWTEICVNQEAIDAQQDAYDACLLDPNLDPEEDCAPLLELIPDCVLGWEWAQPGPYFRFRQPDDKGYHNRMPVEEVASDDVTTDPLTDAEIMSGTDGILIEGSANGAGPGSSDDAPIGPGSDQGNAADPLRDPEGPGYKDEFKGDNTPPKPGYGPFDPDSQYPFLEYFNLPTPKGTGSGGGGGKK